MLRQACRLLPWSSWNMTSTLCSREMQRSRTSESRTVSAVLAAWTLALRTAPAEPDEATEVLLLKLAVASVAQRA